MVPVQCRLKEPYIVQSTAALRFRCTKCTGGLLLKNVILYGDINTALGNESRGSDVMVSPGAEQRWISVLKHFLSTSTLSLSLSLSAENTTYRNITPSLSAPANVCWHSLPSANHRAALPGREKYPEHEKKKKKKN